MYDFSGQFASYKRSRCHRSIQSLSVHWLPTNRRDHTSMISPNDMKILKRPIDEDINAHSDMTAMACINKKKWREVSSESECKRDRRTSVRSSKIEAAQFLGCSYGYTSGLFVDRYRCKQYKYSIFLRLRSVESNICHRYPSTSTKQRTNTYICKRFISTRVVSCRVCPEMKGELITTSELLFILILSLRC